MTFPLPDFEKDLPVTEDDCRALAAARLQTVEPVDLEWAWISLRQQFPHLPQDRSTSEGWEEFEL